MVKSLVMGDSGKKMVTVIGGGFAGLAAAAELSSHNGIQVTLVEAANYLGTLLTYHCYYSNLQRFRDCQKT